MVIVNDGSRDRTLEILREQEKTHASDRTREGCCRDLMESD